MNELDLSLKNPEPETDSRGISMRAREIVAGVLVLGLPHMYQYLTWGPGTTVIYTTLTEVQEWRKNRKDSSGK